MRRSLAFFTGLAVLTPFVCASTIQPAGVSAVATQVGEFPALWGGLAEASVYLALLALPLMGWALVREVGLRRRAQQLAESERAEVEAILTSVPAAVLVSTRERVVRANPLALETLGVDRVDVLAPPEVVAERLSLRGTQQTPIAFQTAVLEPGLSGRTGTAEVLAQVRGREQTFQVAYGPVRSHERIDAVVGVFTDVTELREKQRALRVSEARLGAVISLAADAILCVRAEGEIVLANHAAEAIFGAERGALEGTLLKGLLESAAVLDTVLTGNGVRNEELQALRRNGEAFPVELSSSRLEVEGEVLFSVLLRDVSERRRRELEQGLFSELGAALTSSLEHEELCVAIGEALTRGFADWCFVDLLEDGGATARRLSASSREPDTFELGKRLQAQTPELRQFVQRPVLRELPGADALIQSLQAHSWLEIPLLARGQVVGCVSVLRTRLPRFEASDLATAEELCRRTTLALDNAALYHEARRATAARDRMLSVVAHDFRNPLHSILMRTQTLAKQQWVTTEGEPIGATLEGISRSARQMNRLIADLLCAEQLEKGKLGLRREQVAPEALTLMALEDIAPLAQEHSLEAEVEPNLPPVQADPARILQVLSNLLGNAVKFTPRHGRIRVSVKKEGNHARFQISDGGPGIPTELRSRLFQPFWQMQRDARGVGLGLWIARQIVEAHKGRIWIEGSEGAGATMCFQLPLAEQESQLTLAAG